MAKSCEAERESRGIELEAISDLTKISSRYLAALEEDHFEQLPGGVFNKGIVRSYARVVGLDEEFWVNRYMEAYQQSGQLKTDDADWIAFAENVGKSRDQKDIGPTCGCAGREWRCCFCCWSGWGGSSGGT